MSAIWGKADVAKPGPQCPLMTHSGHGVSNSAPPLGFRRRHSFAHHRGEMRLGLIVFPGCLSVVHLPWYADVEPKTMSAVVIFGGGGFLGRRFADRLTAEDMIMADLETLP